MIVYRVYNAEGEGFEPIEKLDSNKEEMIIELNFASQADNGHDCGASYFSFFSTKRVAEKFIKKQCQIEADEEDYDEEDA